MWSSSWRCDTHGEVHPLLPARGLSRDGLESVLRATIVPMLLPWPLPQGWLVSGFTSAGDERTGARATVVALSGPDPAGGPADLLVIVEEPGVGLGAGFAGLDNQDPGDGFADGPPHATVAIGSRGIPLWHVEAAEPAVFAGEVQANWLWLVFWPHTAGILAVEPIPMRDLRDRSQDLDLPFGAPSRRLLT